MAGNNSNTIIQIRRSQLNAEPLTLANGELAYSFASEKLFIGKTETANSATSVAYIGGELLVDKVANLENILLNGGDIAVSNVVALDTATLDKLVLSTYTENAVLFTKEGGEVDTTTGSIGTVMQIASNGTPTFGNLDGGTF